MSMCAMNASGVIAEFNPFHRGHKILLQQIRNNGADCIVVAMSGNFVQRGEPAFLPKAYRAKAALMCGADLVLELPLPWAMSSAEHFARGGVFLLNEIGCSSLWFGSECGSIDLLSEASQQLDSEEVILSLRENIKAGVPFAKAREDALRSLHGQAFSSLLQQPNNILGIEYCRAIRFFKSKMQAVTISRSGAGHHDWAPSEGVASAGSLRKWVTQSGDITHQPFWAQYMPLASFQLLKEAIQNGHAPGKISYIERAVLSALRSMPLSDLAQLPDIAEGLENRLYKAIQEASSLEQLMDTVKTKRYAHARIRRIVMSAFLGVQKQHGDGFPPYLRVLGMTPAGEQFLKEKSDPVSLPFLLSSKDISRLTETGKKIFELENHSSDLYGMTLPNPTPCGTEYTYSLIKIPSVGHTD